MEHCQHHFECAFVFFLMHVDGDASAVVDHGYGVVFVYGYLDMGAETGQGLVDGVVDNFVNQVVQSFDADVADIHGRAFAHGFQTLQHLDVAGAVLLLFLLFQIEYSF